MRRGTKSDLIIPNDEITRSITKTHCGTITALMRRTKTTRANERAARRERGMWTVGLYCGQQGRALFVPSPFV